MVRRCVVHIGMHKTGSSSIQDSLNGLSSMAFRYARLSKTPNHSGAIVTVFSQQSRHRRKHAKHIVRSKAPDLLRLQAKLEKELSRQNDTLVISGEGIVKLELRELQEFREFLQQFVSEISVFCYVRSPQSYMESALQQRIKAGVVKFDLDKCYPNYRERFKKFDHTFGEDNVRFLPFGSKVLANRCVVTDFCQQLGIDTASVNIIRVNESLSLEAIRLLYNYHKCASQRRKGIGMNSQYYSQLLVHLASLSGKKLKLSSQLTTPILEAHQVDLEWIESRLGRSLQTLQQKSSPESEITSELDLLHVDKSTIDWLCNQIEIEINNVPSREEQIALFLSKCLKALSKKLSADMTETECKVS